MGTPFNHTKHGSQNTIKKNEKSLKIGRWLPATRFFSNIKQLNYYYHFFVCIFLRSLSSYKYENKSIRTWEFFLKSFEIIITTKVMTKKEKKNSFIRITRLF